MQTVSRLHSAAMRTGRSAGVVVALAAAPFLCARADTAPVLKNESSVTLYGGDRFGGSLTDSTTNSTIDLDNGSSVAAAVDIGLDRNSQVELFFSRQNTALPSSAFASPSSNTGLVLNNYQIGGTLFFEQVGRGPYIMGGIGGTTVQPKQAGLNSQTFFSGNLGVGWMVPLGAHVGLRFEARGYGMLLNNDSALFCGGARGCTVAITGNGLVYGEVLAGVAVRF
jgi:hypothetical protein